MRVFLRNLTPSECSVGCWAAAGLLLRERACGDEGEEKGERDCELHFLEYFGGGCYLVIRGAGPGMLCV